MGAKIHFKQGGEPDADGKVRSVTWSACGEIGTPTHDATENPEEVTCERCKATRAYRRTVTMTCQSTDQQRMADMRYLLKESRKWVEKVSRDAYATRDENGAMEEEQFDTWVSTDSLLAAIDQTLREEDDDES